MKTLYLVDVSSMFFRAFYAVRPLSNSKGTPTNAVYGFLSMTIKLLKDVKPDYLAFCYDRPEPSFRKELDPNYKAHRQEMPVDLGLQIPYIKRLADALGICSFEKQGFEADDIIGTLANWGAHHKLDVVIVSGDKDFSQLVGPHVTLYDTMKDQRMDAKYIAEKWGVPPERFIDYLAIVGDTSDNIPGVAGIGLKGAAKLLTEFASLEEIYDNLDKISSKSIVQKLKDGRENAFLSRKLVTIVTEMDLEFSLDHLKLQGIKRDDMVTLLEELEFRTFERLLLDMNNATKKDAAPEEQVKEIPAPKPREVNTVERSVSLDEFKALLRPEQEVWGIAIPAGIFFGIGNEALSVHADSHDIVQALDEKRVRWKGYDLKEFWKTIPVREPQAAWDHMLAAYVLRAGPPGSLEDVYERTMGEKLGELLSASQLLHAHQSLEQVLREQLKPVGGETVLSTIELPLVSVLTKMERRGVLLDTTILREQSEGLSRDLRTLEQKIYKEAGEEFNIGSPKQLGQILFEKLKMPTGKKTKTGFSTDTEVLEKLAPTYPISSLILEWRELSKLKSTYVDALPQLVDPKTGRVHTTFNQALTTTGRLSSTSPNLQNIPIRTPRGGAIRKAFIADPDCCLISADYSQIELRILAHMTDDPGLTSAFEHDLDIHAATAARVFDVPLEKVTSDLRRTAKAVNFGIAYGQGAFGLSETLGIGRAEATNIIAQYFARFPKVREFMDNTIENAKRLGYVETMFGRRRYLDELKSKNPAIKKFGERAAINAPMQGTASDLVKMAMTQIDQQLDARMLLQVHDELIFEVAVAESDAVAEQVRAVMENIVRLKVPLKVNVAIGANWGDAHG